jgi:acetyl esterase/lipase
MNSRYLIDPELLPVIDAFPHIDFDGGMLAETRRLMDSYLPQADPSACPNVEMVERFVPGPVGAPAVRTLLYRPIGAGLARPLPALLHLHGGAYVLGRPEMNDTINRARADELCSVVLSVDYRKAPETPHPGPVQDAYAALNWLYTNAAELGIDTKRIAVIGESAGGGLAAALALFARDKGGPDLCLQMLIYPMLDDRVGSTDEPHPYAGEYVFRREDCKKAWAHYLGREPGGPATDPHASPARASDLARLPPTFLSVGALDLFVEEGIEYVRRLIRAGVPAELHVYPGSPHGPDLLSPTKIAQRVRSEYMSALKRGLKLE